MFSQDVMHNNSLNWSFTHMLLKRKIFFVDAQRGIVVASRPSSITLHGLVAKLLDKHNKLVKTVGALHETYTV